MRYLRAGLLGLLLAGAFAHAEDGPLDVRDFGAVGDGVADDSAAFRKALVEAGEDGATLVVVRGEFQVRDLHIPPNMTLAFRQGGRLHVPDGESITIDGAIEAAIAPIFTGEGAVGGRAQLRYVYPQWFGAAGDGSRDDSGALQRAADFAAGAMGRTLFIPEGEYLFENDVVIRSHVENRGLLVKAMEIDEDRTQFSLSLFLPTHYPRGNPRIRFESDHPEVELDMEAFYGVEEGGLLLPRHEAVPRADGEGTVDLEEGGTFRLYSSDFFTSRRVRKGDHFYDKNDISQLVSGRGDVFPEFAFDYPAPPDADLWDAETNYQKADYVTHEGELFKATWASGPDADITHPIFGRAELGPVEPRPGAATTVHEYPYDDGTEDTVFAWRRVRTQAWYRPKDTPLTVNDLRVEVRLKNHGGEHKRINAGAVLVARSNMTFNNPHFSVRDPEATMFQLLQSTGCVNLHFNRGYFSGATAAHMGYNILNSNVANVRYTDCTSTNSRKGLDGRHGKNITIEGGFFNVIDDHYARNYVIRDVVLSGRSVHVPGDSTPEADLQQWHFRPRVPFNFSGANVHIENCTVDGASGGILSARGDVSHLYGRVVLRGIHVRNNEGGIRVFNHWRDRNFDFAHELPVPDLLVIEDITLENPARVSFAFGNGFEGGQYGLVRVRNVGPIGQVQSSSRVLDFMDCTFLDTEFDVEPGSLVNLRNSLFAGASSGLDPAKIGRAQGNALRVNATTDFPLDYLNEAEYMAPDTGGGA